MVQICIFNPAEITKKSVPSGAESLGIEKAWGKWRLSPSAEMVILEGTLLASGDPDAQTTKGNSPFLLTLFIE
jgi:hypothetical protein